MRSTRREPFVPPSRRNPPPEPESPGPLAPNGRSGLAPGDDGRRHCPTCGHRVFAHAFVGRDGKVKRSCHGCRVAWARKRPR